MKKILTILAVMAVFVASFAAKAQDRTCKTDSICGREIVKSAMKYLGSPYRSGHMSPKSGFDCSGFTTFIFSSRTSRFRAHRVHSIQHSAETLKSKTAAT